MLGRRDWDFSRSRASITTLPEPMSFRGSVELPSHPALGPAGNFGLRVLQGARPERICAINGLSVRKTIRGRGRVLDKRELLTHHAQDVL